MTDFIYLSLVPKLYHSLLHAVSLQDMRDNDSPQLPISQALGKDASLNIPPGLSSSIHFIQSRELIYLFVLSIFLSVCRVGVTFAKPTFRSFQLFISGSNYNWLLSFFLKLPHYLHVLSMIFSISICSTTTLLPNLLSSIQCNIVGLILCKVSKLFS